MTDEFFQKVSHVQTDAGVSIPVSAVKTLLIVPGDITTGVVADLNINGPPYWILCLTL
jgi:hypothetical protein